MLMSPKLIVQGLILCFYDNSQVNLVTETYNQKGGIEENI